MECSDERETERVLVVVESVEAGVRESNALVNGAIACNEKIVAYIGPTLCVLVVGLNGLEANNARVQIGTSASIPSLMNYNPTRCVHERLQKCSIGQCTLGAPISAANKAEPTAGG